MSLARDIPLLRQVPLLEDFTDEQLRLLAFSAENVVADAGETVYRQGDRANASYVVASGSVTLQREEDGSSEDLATMGPGALLGEMALFVETERPNTAIAREPTELIRIRRALFKRMLQEYPEVARGMYSTLATRLQSTSGELMRIAETLDALNINPIDSRRG